MMYKGFWVFTRRHFLVRKPTFRDYFFVPSSGSRGNPALSRDPEVGNQILGFLPKSDAR
jgi:hypothetical protein